MFTPDADGDTTPVGGPDDDLIQLLTPDGERVHHESYSARVDHLDTEALQSLYRDMVMVRRFDTEATSLQRHGELGLWPPCLGQEAAQVGSGRALGVRDYVFPSYRELGVAWTRGVDLRKTLHLFRGEDHGGWDPAEHNFHLYTLVIGAHTLHATGYAMGIQRDGDVGTGNPDRDRAAVAYFGDGATAQGDVNEALTFAAVNDAPVVFFCQNNQWAISEPAQQQSRVPLFHRGRGFGVPSVRVDGNDVLASHAVMLEALERARSGGGPTFIEAVTYRMGAHTTSDDPTKYRTRAEEEMWRRRDPIDRLHALLVREGESEQFFTELEAETEQFGAEIREYCRAIAAPGTERMFEHVYASENPQVSADRAWLAEYEEGFATEEASA
ncbi:pyruvate dehydrogenase (acetyl-transferring) E1 component subunit alpha [Ruania halotolerans]|uniref:pyruvate dehydrogenase (acetyl-transferring) E1 component subunit alpha n=1 Tax=Ruania halotolerans TaxID=2897773 RepID=UPI001E5EEB4D|nr:pyruvate dehydrogenase (acetyl-transferring) E1 component subunit alpha [Ruania halotolerans]UFU06287.1 pyruvate dehydrogenase (acetyl-transferring) E1 component subunit alpha [Ruania halotolerans]